MVASIALAVLCNYFYGVSMKLWVPQNSITAEISEECQTGENFDCYFPFGNVYYYARKATSVDYNGFSSQYVSNNSVCSYFLACLLYNMLSPAGEIIQLADSQQEEIEKYIHKPDNVVVLPKTNLIFILVESLESWPIDSICGYAYMPNVHQLTQQEHVLYADKLCSQVRHGNSADGQMIDVTGLLPVFNGATCACMEGMIIPIMPISMPILQLSIRHRVPGKNL